MVSDHRRFKTAALRAVPVDSVPWAPSEHGVHSTRRKKPELKYSSSTTPEIYFKKLCFE